MPAAHLMTSTAAVLIIGLLGSAVAGHPKEQHPDSNCIQMTPQNIEKLDALMYEVVEYLAKLTSKYPEFSIKSLKLVIDNINDKTEDTLLEIAVNDCERTDKAAQIEESKNPEEANPEIEDVILLDLPDSTEDVLRYRRGGENGQFLIYYDQLRQFMLP